MGEHEPPAEPDAKSQEQGKCQTRDAPDDEGDYLASEASVFGQCLARI